MISSDAGQVFDGLARTLAAKAKALAEGRVRTRMLAAPWRWRRAGLLWPTFGGE